MSCLKRLSQCHQFNELFQKKVIDRRCHFIFRQFSPQEMKCALKKILNGSTQTGQNWIKWILLDMVSLTLNSRTFMMRRRQSNKYLQTGLFLEMENLWAQRIKFWCQFWHSNFFFNISFNHLIESMSYFDTIKFYLLETIGSIKFGDRDHVISNKREINESKWNSYSDE